MYYLIYRLQDFEMVRALKINQLEEYNLKPTRPGDVSHTERKPVS